MRAPTEIVGLVGLGVNPCLVVKPALALRRITETTHPLRLPRSLKGKFFVLSVSVHVEREQALVSKFRRLVPSLLSHDSTHRATLGNIRNRNAVGSHRRAKHCLFVFRNSNIRIRRPFGLPSREAKMAACSAHFDVAERRVPARFIAYNA